MEFRSVKTTTSTIVTLRTPVKTGQMTSKARQVYEALLKNGALDAVRLRHKTHLSTEANKGRFD